MGLDDTFQALGSFRLALAEFQEALIVSAAALTRAEDSLSGIWEDSFRSDFERRRSELIESIQRFVTTTGPEYDSFIATKYNQLDRYLNQ